MPTHHALYQRDHPDTPVFDRARTVDLDPSARAGLSKAPTGRHSRNPETSTAIGFSRTDSDRRSGTPLPPEATGDPRPDRLEHAERIRKALEERDNRFKIPLADPQYPAPTPRRYNPRSQTPDIEKPRSYYVDISAAEAAIEGRRDGETLYFMTVSDAAYCLTGESRDVWRTAVKNAAGGITKTAFGWEWTRLRSRRGANR